MITSVYQYLKPLFNDSIGANFRDFRTTGFPKPPRSCTPTETDHTEGGSNENRITTSQFFQPSSSVKCISDNLENFPIPARKTNHTTSHFSTVPPPPWPLESTVRFHHRSLCVVARSMTPPPSSPSPSLSTKARRRQGTRAGGNGGQAKLQGVGEGGADSNHLTGGRKWAWSPETPSKPWVAKGYR